MRNDTVDAHEQEHDWMDPERVRRAGCTGGERDVGDGEGQDSGLVERETGGRW